MAGAESDRLWDGWMDELSASYGKTAEALAAGRSATALAEYKQHFLPAVQRMYTSIVSIPPDRYAKATDWATWSRQFYILSVKAGKALQAKPAAQKREALDALRTHFSTGVGTTRSLLSRALSILIWSSRNWSHASWRGERRRKAKTKPA